MVLLEDITIPYGIGLPIVAEIQEKEAVELQEENIAQVDSFSGHKIMASTIPDDDQFASHWLGTSRINWFS